MKIASFLGVKVFFVNLLIWALKNSWIKFEWDLPGKQILWTKLTSAFDDNHITDEEIILVLEELKNETTNTIGDSVIDALIWAVQLVSPINWDLSGKWENYWKPIVTTAKDGKLTNIEVGSLLETLIRW